MPELRCLAGDPKTRLDCFIAIVAIVDEIQIAGINSGAGAAPSGPAIISRMPTF
jgi:hypothetical protein